MLTAKLVVSLKKLL